jgi:hypothetical protein
LAYTAKHPEDVGPTDAEPPRYPGSWRETIESRWSAQAAGTIYVSDPNQLYMVIAPIDFNKNALQALTLVYGTMGFRDRRNVSSMVNKK